MPREAVGAGWFRVEMGRSTLNERAKPATRDMPQGNADVMGRSLADSGLAGESKIRSEQKKEGLL